MLNSDLERFIFGFIGSASVEVVYIYRLFHERHNNMPSHYRRVKYWGARFLLACVGGLLALLYSIDKPILAIHIGASAPIIVKQLMESNPQEQID